MLLANGNGTFQGPKQARNRDIVNWCQLSHKFDHGRADRKMIDVRTKIIQGTIWIVVLAACLLGASVPVTCICRAKAGYSGVTERVTRLARAMKLSRALRPCSSSQRGWVGIYNSPGLGSG